MAANRAGPGIRAVQRLIDNWMAALLLVLIVLAALSGWLAHDMDMDNALHKRSRAGRVTGKSPLASLKELLRPFAINTLCDPFAPAKLGDGFLTAQTIQHDVNLFFRRILPVRCTADIFDSSLESSLSHPRFLSHFHPLRSLR